MVKAAARSPEFEQLGPRFRIRDFIAGIGLFAATVCVVLWQNAHVAILWDTSYVLDSAIRFAHGQMPYRDFPFVHPPLTFLVQAAIIRFTGRVFFHHVVYAAVVGGLATLLTWRIALTSLRGRVAASWMVALLLAATLTVLGIYSIIPIPEYDGECAFWILFALWLLQKADFAPDPKTTRNQNERCHPERPEQAGTAKRRELKDLRLLFAKLERPDPFIRGFAAGVALCLPLFTKQNMGLPFLAASIGAVLLVLAFALTRRDQERAADARTLLSILGGTGATLFAAALALHWTAGIRNYFYWTITFAGERRLPGLGPMLTIFRDPALLWTLPCIAAGSALLSW